MNINQPYFYGRKENEICVGCLYGSSRRIPVKISYEFTGQPTSPLSHSGVEISVPISWIYRLFCTTYFSIVRVVHSSKPRSSAKSQTNIWAGAPSKECRQIRWNLRGFNDRNPAMKLSQFSHVLIHTSEIIYKKGTTWETTKRYDY